MRLRQDPATVVVAGMVAGDPHQGGATWAVLQYVLGLRQLGHDVVLLDPLPPGPVAPAITGYFDALCTDFDLHGRAALVPRRGSPYGMDRSGLRDAVRRASVLLNISGRWRDDELMSRIPIRVYVDLDPGFTQLWHHQGADVGLDHHTHHVTVGAGVTYADSPLPSATVNWRPVLPPVLLAAWPHWPRPERARLTTVANWRSYGSIEHGGVHYGQKAHAFRQLTALPAASPVPLAVALSIHAGDAADRVRMIQAGWQLLDPGEEAGDPHRYQAFVRQSWAELGVAKTGYVWGRTGWVSDRTACYLASGRPCIVQDTGLGDVLPLGEGLLAFNDVDGAVEAIERVSRDYERHAAAARSIAETHLDSRRVLGALIADVAA